MKKKKAILCVDDEPIILASLKMELTQTFGNEFIIETAESGEEALEVIDSLVGDDVQTLVIISDWLMPNMKGDELLTQVHLKFPKMIKIMLSGQADQKAISRVEKEIKAAFMAKPWKGQDLSTFIKKQLL